MNPKERQKPERAKVENRVRGLGKSMRSVEVLEKEYKKNKKNLTAGEKRLLDVITFEKTGKHIDEFKEKKKPKKPDFQVLQASVPADDIDKLVEVKTRSRKSPDKGGQAPRPGSESVS